MLQANLNSLEDAVSGFYLIKPEAFSFSASKVVVDYLFYELSHRLLLLPLK